MRIRRWLAFPGVISDGALFCDAEIVRLAEGLRERDMGADIGMATIKQRRLRLHLTSHPGLRVGDCVPFYFCPRSMMLYVIYRAGDPELS